MDTIKTTLILIAMALCVMPSIVGVRVSIRLPCHCKFDPLSYFIFGQLRLEAEEEEKRAKELAEQEAKEKVFTNI